MNRYEEIFVRITAAMVADTSYGGWTEEHIIRTATRLADRIETLFQARELAQQQARQHIDIDRVP